MNYSELYENKKRGTFDFPIELYYVDDTSSRYQMPLHWHLEYELITILKGEFKLSLDRSTVILRQGDSAWIGGGVVHGGIPFNCVYECVVFDLSMLLKDTPVCSNITKDFLSNENGYTNVFRKDSALAEICDKLFDSMEREQNGYEWITVGYMWQLMGNLIALKSDKQIITQSKTQINKLKNVLTYIRNNFATQISLDELAQVAHMSPRYFCRAFSAITGKTPIEYLNYYRIEIAGEHLLMTDDSVTDIAFSCGFNDTGYFSKVFSRYKGKSPSVFRKSGHI